MRRVTAAILAAFGMFAATTVTVAQEQPAQQKVEFRVEVRGSIVGDFIASMDTYAEMRRVLGQGLPALEVTDDPGAIARAETLLADRIRHARASARRGDIFSPPIQHVFRQILVAESSASACQSIRADNPGAFSHSINGAYPKTRPFSTMPAGMLAVLPPLPTDVQYRFVGRHLILHDLRANIILDRLPDALRCTPSHAR